jgi:hypothetical protein
VEIPAGPATSLAGNELGKYFLHLREHPEWVIRRVETAYLVDSDRVERRVTLDIDVSDLKDRAKRLGFEDTSSLYIPLSQTIKDLIVDYDVRDQFGSSLPVLPSDCDSRVAQLMLAAVLEKVATQAQLEGTFLNKFWEIAKSVPTDKDRKRIAEASGEIEAWSFSAKDHISQDQLALWSSFFANESFAELALTFTTQFNPLVRISTDKGDTQIIKTRYVDTGAEPRVGFWGALGLASAEYLLAAPGLGRTGRWHLRIVAPTGTHVVSVGLNELIPDSADATTPKLIGSQFYDSAIVPERALLHVEGQPRGDYVAPFWLVPDLVGFIRPALVSAWATAMMLGAGCWGELASKLISKLNEGNVDAATALLILLPSAYALQVSRLGEHEIRGRLMNWPRNILVSTAAVVLFAAIDVVVAHVFVPEVTDWVWGIASAWCALTGIYFSVLAGRSRSLIQNVRKAGSITINRPILRNVRSTKQS